jgi:hypothetical protein
LRWERFDVGHEAEALARFDELVTSPPPSSPPRPAKAHPVLRRVPLERRDREHKARFVATFATGDEVALEKLFQRGVWKSSTIPTRQPMDVTDSSTRFAGCGEREIRGYPSSRSRRSESPFTSRPSFDRRQRDGGRTFRYG